MNWKKNIILWKKNRDAIRLQKKIKKEEQSKKSLLIGAGIFGTLAFILYALADINSIPETEDTKHIEIKENGNSN